MILCHKIVIDPNDFEKVLIVVGPSEADLRWILDREDGVKITGIAAKPWYGFTAYYAGVKGSDADLAKIVEKYPPQQFSEDTNWGYKDVL